MSFGKSCWWVLFGLRPFCVSGLLFFALTKRKSGWGICGSSFRFWVVFFVLVRCDLPALLGLLGRVQIRFLTAYTHVRTEPQCDIGQTRGKKDQPIMCQKRSLGNMYKNGSSLIGDYVGEHQQLTGLPFRPNPTSYGSLQQGQRGLTLYPSRLDSWNDTLRADKQHYLEYTTRSQT